MLIDLYMEGRLDLDGFVSETIGVGDVEEAFHKMEQGEVLRSVVAFERAFCCCVGGGVGVQVWGDKQLAAIGPGGETFLDYNIQGVWRRGWRMW